MSFPEFAACAAGKKFGRYLNMNTAGLRVRKSAQKPSRRASQIPIKTAKFSANSLGVQWRAVERRSLPAGAQAIGFDLAN